MGRLIIHNQLHEPEKKVFRDIDYVVSGNKSGYEKQHQLSQTDGLIYDRTTLMVDGASIFSIERTNYAQENLKVESDFPYLQMHFELKGNSCTYAPLDYQEKLFIDSGQHSIFYYPWLNGTLNHQCKTSAHSVEIELSMELLSSVLNHDLGCLGKFAEDIQARRPGVLGGRSFPITFQMREIIAEIFACPYSDSLKKIFLDCKIRELLYRQLRQILAEPDTQKMKIAPADLARTHHIKEILDQQFLTPPSIAELSSLACMNRTKLQDHFKTVFGETIYGYLATVKMENARHLLEDRSLKIADIASRVGFKNATHFTAAFKKKFGSLPKHFR